MTLESLFNARHCYLRGLLSVADNAGCRGRIRLYQFFPDKIEIRTEQISVPIPSDGPPSKGSRRQVKGVVGAFGIPPFSVFNDSTCHTAIVTAWWAKPCICKHYSSMWMELALPRLSGPYIYLHIVLVSVGSSLDFAVGAIALRRSEKAIS